MMDVLAGRSGGHTAVVLPVLTQGVAAPMLGASAATSFDGWTELVTGNNDDEYISFEGWDFSFYMAGQGYQQCFISSNHYATFGEGASTYNVSASSPSLPKIMFGASDRSRQRIYTQKTSSFARFRFEGFNNYQGTTPGNSDRIIEVTLWKLAGGVQWVEIRTGAMTDTGLLMVASASTAYATGTIQANSSWVFEGNEDGTAWTLNAEAHMEYAG